MVSVQSRFAKLRTWANWLIPSRLRDASTPGSADRLRRASLLVFVTAAGVATGIASSVLHLTRGDPYRAAFTVVASVAMASAVFLLRRIGRIEPAIHLYCFLVTALVVASPYFSSLSKPIFVALVAVPVAANTVGGWRIGIVWTAITFAILSFAAGFLPLDPFDRTLAWSTAIVGIVSGVSLAIADVAHQQAVGEANAARDRAEDAFGFREVAEAALNESRLLFEAAFRQSLTIMQLGRPATGEILDVSQGYLDAFGFSREQVIGSSVTELGTLASEELRVQLASDFGQSASDQDIETQVMTRSGKTRWISLTGTFIQVEGHQALLVQAIDITERKRIDEQLKAQRRELEDRFEERGRQLDAQQSKLRESERLASVGTLAAGIAHQINNPIGGLVAAAELALRMRDEPNSEDHYVSALETARDEGMRCGRIVKSVLQFARDEPTQKWIEDINPIVRRAAELARPYAEARRGRLSIEPSPEPLLVKVSPIDLEQVLLNLVRNAAESNDSGVGIRVETHHTGDSAEIHVIDDGRGIDEQQSSMIFDPFFTTRIGQGGTGLGLSVAHGIVSDHGGQIEVDSSVGEGTRFSVRLPIAKKEIPRTPPT